MKSDILSAGVYLCTFQHGNFTGWSSEGNKVLPLIALKPEQKAPSFLRSQPTPHCGRTEQKKSERRKANQPKLHKADNNLNKGNPGDVSEPLKRTNGVSERESIQARRRKPNNRCKP